MSPTFVGSNLGPIGSWATLLSFAVALGLMAAVLPAVGLGAATATWWWIERDNAITTARALRRADPLFAPDELDGERAGAAQRTLRRQRRPLTTAALSHDNSETLPQCY